MSGTGVRLRDQDEAGASAVATGGLFIGPWFGEFGHEIMFVGMARAAAESYDRVTACSHPGSGALYSDFVDEFLPHDIECESVIAGCTADTRPNGATLARWKSDGDAHFVPREYNGRGPVTWRRYGAGAQREKGLVVLHARNRKHVAARNWPVRHWNGLARRLFRAGIATRIACIGLRATALTVEGALDLRDAALARQMNALAAADFAMGPSSGPMHLASHCGCPHLVWCGGGASEVARTRKRYQSEWNPFRTLVLAHPCGSWQPSPETVWGWVEALVARIAKEKDSR